MAHLYLSLFPQTLNGAFNPSAKVNLLPCPPLGDADAGCGVRSRDKTGIPGPQEVTPWHRGKGSLASPAVPGC